MNLYRVSPFAKKLRALRIERHLQQREAAELLGYEQSHLSALERGSKGPPKQDFVDKLIKVYQLTDSETTQVLDDLRRSKRRYLLAREASPDEYEIWASMERQSGALQPKQIELIKLALSLN